MSSGAALYVGGITGAGLLVLRIAVAISTLMLVSQPSSQPFFAQCLGVCAAGGLCFGFQTRALAVFSLLASLLGLGTPTIDTPMLHAIAAVALALTGPGAFSADARLFGRRTITLSGRDDSDTIE